MARPTTYTEKQAEEICERLAGGESLRSICSLDNFPDKSTVFRWLAANASFCDQYARAKQAGCDALFEELLEIADDGSNDWMERELASGAIVSVPDHEHINRSRLRVDARKWALSKLNPKKYGESSRIAHTDPDGNVLRVEVTRVNPK